MAIPIEDMVGEGQSERDFPDVFAPLMPRARETLQMPSSVMQGASTVTVQPQPQVQIPQGVFDMARPRAGFDAWNAVPQSQQGYRSLGLSPVQAMTGGSRDTNRVRNARGMVESARDDFNMNADRGMQFALAFLRDLVNPAVTAQGNIGAQQAAAQGRRDVATIEGQTQRDVAEAGRPSMMEQVFKGMDSLAKLYGVQNEAGRPTVLPEGSMALGRDGQTLATNPRPQPIFQQLDDGSIVTTGGMRVSRPSGDQFANGNAAPMTQPQAQQQMPPGAVARKFDQATGRYIYRDANGNIIGN